MQLIKSERSPAVDLAALSVQGKIQGKLTEVEAPLLGFVVHLLNSKSYNKLCNVLTSRCCGCVVGFQFLSQTCFDFLWIC